MPILKIDTLLKKLLVIPKIPDNEMVVKGGLCEGSPLLPAAYFCGFFSGLWLVEHWSPLLKAPVQEGWRNDRDLFTTHHA